MRTKVIQSYRTYNIPQWISKCQLSVAKWAKINSYDYELIDDKFFSVMPEKYSEVNLWTKTDLCRLIWLKKALKDYDRVVWADADFIIFEPNKLDINGKSHGFSYESVHDVPGLNNAFMFFNKGEAVLEHYYEESVKVLDKGNIFRTAIGPVVLRDIDKVYSLNKILNLGLLYPPLTNQIIGNGGCELDKYISILPAPLYGANMCNFIRELVNHSFNSIFIDCEYNKVVDSLLKTRGKEFNTKWEE